MITCPFCHEPDFDQLGLKIHLQRHCDVFRELHAFLPPFAPAEHPDRCWRCQRPREEHPR